MKKILMIWLTLVSILGEIPLLQAQNDTTNDTWRIDGNNTITDSTTIITKNLGIGPANLSYDADGLHLIDRPIFLQRANSIKWRITTSSGPAGPLWIQNFRSDGNTNNVFRMEANGWLGLGTGASISPKAQLHVKSYNHKALLVQGGLRQGTVPIFQVIKDDQEPLFSIFNERKIGIGTTVPTASLDIATSDSIAFQNYSGLKVLGKFANSAAQIVNTYSGNNASGLIIETTDNNGQGNALAVKINRTNSPKTMLRIPNYSATDNFILLAEDGGKVGIGTSNPQKALDVCGHIRAKEVVIESDWCDYVFDKNYRLPSLQEQEQFILEHGHLKNFKSGEEMKNEIEVADVTTRQQQTIEEMMLYLIEMEQKFQQENKGLKKRIETLEKELSKQK